LCPKCLVDLRPEKQTLGLSIVNPEASYNDLLNKSLKPNKTSSSHPAAKEAEDKKSGGFFSKFKKFAKGLVGEKVLPNAPSEHSSINEPAILTPKKVDEVINPNVIEQVNSVNEALEESEHIELNTASDLKIDLEENLNIDFKTKETSEEVDEGFTPENQVDFSEEEASDINNIISAEESISVFENPLNLDQDLSAASPNEETPEASQQEIQKDSEIRTEDNLELLPLEDAASPSAEEASSETIQENSYAEIVLGISPEIVSAENEVAPEETIDLPYPLLNEREFIPEPENAQQFGGMPEADNIPAALNDGQYESQVDDENSLPVIEEIVPAINESSEEVAHMEAAQIKVHEEANEASSSQISEGPPAQENEKDETVETPDTDIFEIDADEEELTVIAQELFQSKEDFSESTQDYIQQDSFQNEPAASKDSFLSDTGSSAQVELAASQASPSLFESSDSLIEAALAYVETEEIQDPATSVGAEVSNMDEEFDEILSSVKTIETPNGTGEEHLEEMEMNTEADEVEKDESDNEDISQLFEASMSSIPENEDFEISLSQFCTPGNPEITVLFDLANQSIENPNSLENIVENVSTSDKREVDTGDLGEILHQAEESISKPILTISAKYDKERDKIRRALGSDTDDDVYAANLRKHIAAGSMRRLASWSIDTLVALGCGFAITIVLSFLLFPELRESFLNFTHLDFYEALPILTLTIVSTLFTLIAYPILSQVFLHKTLGAKICSIKILNDNFKLPSVASIIVRCAVFPLSMICGGFINIMLGRRALHEMLSKTSYYLA